MYGSPERKDNKRRVYQNFAGEVFCLMAYSLNLLQDDCYENSSVLINKFNIRDEKSSNIWNKILQVCLLQGP